MASRSKCTKPQKTRKFGTAVQPSGPLKATQTFGLTTYSSGCLDANWIPACTGSRSGTDSRRSSSPDSPTWSHKETKRSSECGLVQRSSSLDTMSSAYYLRGTWPRAGLSRTAAAADTDDLDKETQTPKQWPREQQSTAAAAITRSSSLGTWDDLREIKAKLSKTKESSSVSSSPCAAFVITSGNLTSTVPTKTSSGKSSRQRNKYIPRHSRGSLEGLNQELEKLSLNSSSSDSDKLDGRRAPVVDLLISDDNDDGVQYSSSVGSDGFVRATFSICGSEDESVSPSVTLPTTDCDSYGGSSVSDLDSECFKFSPPKLAVTRLPPDGCESVVCKMIENGHPLPTNGEIIPAPVTPVTIDFHIPSEKSAFYPPLLEKYISQSLQQCLSDADACTHLSSVEVVAD